MTDVKAVWYDKEIVIRVSEQLLSHLDAAGAWVAQRAAQLAPVLTGRLKKGIDHVLVARGSEPAAIVGVTKASHAWYGRFVEKGTKKMKAQPFLGPAVFDNRKEIERIVREGK